MESHESVSNNLVRDMRQLMMVQARESASRASAAPQGKESQPNILPLMDAAPTGPAPQLEHKQLTWPIWLEPKRTSILLHFGSKRD